MIKRKAFYILYLLALVLITSACQSQENEGNEIEIEVIDEDTGIVETEADANLGEGETGEETTIALGEEDAMHLVEEKLPDAGFEAKLAGSITKGDNDYYIFEIKKDGVLLKQMLAVDDEEGKIYTYDDKESEISDYKAFEYYDSAKDSSIDWSGVYSNDKYEISIDNTDPGNIEYCVREGQKDIFVNVAYFTDYANAISESEEYGKIDLQLDGATLIIKCEKDCEFSGTYRIELLR